MLTDAEVSGRRSHDSNTRRPSSLAPTPSNIIGTSRTSWSKRSITGLPSTACPALMQKADRRRSSSWSVWCCSPSVRARRVAMTSLAAVRVGSPTCWPASSDAMNQGFSSSAVARPTRSTEPGGIGRQAGQERLEGVGAGLHGSVVDHRWPSQATRIATATRSTSMITGVITLNPDRVRRRRPRSAGWLQRWASGPECSKAGAGQAGRPGYGP